MPALGNSLQPVSILHMEHSSHIHHSIRVPLAASTDGARGMEQRQVTFLIVVVAVSVRVGELVDAVAQVDHLFGLAVDLEGHLTVDKVQPCAWDNNLVVDELEITLREGLAHVITPLHCGVGV